MIEDIKVSVCCPVYNHEPYLRKMLDSLVCQKTDFKFEIIVSDDCSSDLSRDILKEYDEKYPGLFRLLLQSENQYSKGKKITLDVVFPEARGDYIAVCEGDDFWCDENKLQKQYDVMKANPTCTLCAHKVNDVDHLGNRLSGCYPSYPLAGGLIKQDEFFHMLFAPSRYWFHTSSFFFPSKVLKKIGGEYPDFIRKSGVGDVPLTWLLASEGDIYYIDEEMSCYRRDVPGSWSLKMQSRGKRRDHNAKFLSALEAFREYLGGKYSELIEVDIRKYRFYGYCLSNDISGMKAKEYRDLYSELPLKQKIKYHIGHYFPFAEKIFLKSNK